MKPDKPKSESLSIVIVGAGFGGVATARELAEHGYLVTLINDNSYFRYSPTLYRVATGYMKKQAIIPLAEILPIGVELVIDAATEINRQKRVITCASGRRINYDYAVFSLGAVTSYFGIAGLEKYSYGIKSLDELERLHTHLHHQLIDEKQLDKNYVIVGGGPTGVELAASLVGYLKMQAKRHKLKRHSVKIELVEAAPRLLPSMNPKTSQAVKQKLTKLGIKVMTDTRVDAETEKSLRTAGRSIPTQTVIWTAGVTTNPFYRQNESQFEFSDRGRIIVDNFLRVDERTFVIGDNSETKFSGLAQVAIRHGHYAAHNILSRIKSGYAPVYQDTPPIYVVPVTSRWAVMEWRQFAMGNFMVSWVRRFADLVGYADIMGWRKAFSLWLKLDRREEHCRLCAGIGSPVLKSPDKKV